MPEKHQTKKSENGRSELGEILLYPTDGGKTEITVRLRNETVWLTQKQLASLFEAERSVITKHINNIIRSGELERDSVCAKFAHTADDGKTYQANCYNLDIIIAVGYRVNARRGTQFRIWATGILKDHLVRGYTVNQRRVAEKGTTELRQVLDLLSSTLTGHNLVGEEGAAVLEIINRYARTWELLLQYDEDRLPVPDRMPDTKEVLEIKKIRHAVTALKKELISKGEATEIFGNEHGNGLARIVGAVQQTFDGQDLYPGFSEKAAHLIYFVIKDHPFTDGNKRIGSFLFLYFLKRNGLLAEQVFDNKALVALALLIAASDPRQKDLMIRLVVNLISERG